MHRRADGDFDIYHRPFRGVWAFGLFWIAVALLTGCTPKTVDYCDLPGEQCQPQANQPPEVQAQLVDQSWCCPDGEPCFPVDAITDCAITDVAIYCEYGRSTPASTEGGTSGFECFG
jgi:hypothetical protein